MTTDRRRALRLLVPAAAGVVLAAGLLTAAPAAAQEGQGGSDGKIVTRTIVMKSRDHADGEGRQVRVFDMNGDAPGCDKTQVGDADGPEKTRIIICGDDKVSAADRAARLEKALAGIEQNDALSAEHKAKVTAALREAIERLQGTR